LPLSGENLDIKLNVGSGQRRFDNAFGWINIDCVSREGQVPDVICDVGREPLPYDDGSVSLAVLHQVYEHFGCGEGHGLIREIYRVLKPGGSLILTVPDMRALAQAWVSHQIDDYIYTVNLMGAFQGEETDRHKWNYCRQSIMKDMGSLGLWSEIKMFNWRKIEGADIAGPEWWILGIEVIK
jgi:ubiquinone/menaquinone biosynthesis C-methylase UbiE